MNEYLLADELDVELAWAAGIFEGEGTITIGRRGRDDTYRLIACIGNTDMQVLAPFHERWGGWLQPFYGKRPGLKPGWMWTLAGPAAAIFIRQIEPYLRTDRVRRKARLGLRFKRHQSNLKKVWSRPDYKPMQRAIYEEMSVLNKRGFVEAK